MAAPARAIRAARRLPMTTGPEVPTPDQDEHALQGLNVRLLAEANQSAAEYQALFEVAGLVSSTLDVERLLDLIVDRCRTLMGVASAGVFRLDRETGVL